MDMYMYACMYASVLSIECAVRFLIRCKYISQVQRLMLAVDCPKGHFVHRKAASLKGASWKDTLQGSGIAPLKTCTCISVSGASKLRTLAAPPA